MTIRIQRTAHAHGMLVYCLSSVTLAVVATMLTTVVICWLVVIHQQINNHDQLLVDCNKKQQL